MATLAAALAAGALASTAEGATMRLRLGDDSGGAPHRGPRLDGLFGYVGDPNAPADEWFAFGSSQREVIVEVFEFGGMRSVFIRGYVSGGRTPSARLAPDGATFTSALLAGSAPGGAGASGSGPGLRRPFGGAELANEPATLDLLDDAQEPLEIPGGADAIADLTGAETFNGAVGARRPPSGRRIAATGGGATGDDGAGGGGSEWEFVGAVAPLPGGGGLAGAGLLLCAGAVGARRRRG